MTASVRTPLPETRLPGESGPAFRPGLPLPPPIRASLARLLLVTSAAILPLSAHAQQVNSDENSSPDARSSAEEVAGETIVVTAQKRAEKVVDVPITMSIKTNQGLSEAGVSNVSDLAQVVPGLRMDASGPYTQPSIRGVSSVVAGPGFAANIATYIDGFYHPVPAANKVSFFDTELVQVLKGPQGTLFGRNSTGGAFLITTRAPSFTPAVAVQASFGNYNEAHGALFASGPISDDLAVSISGYYDRSDGFNKNIITNKRVGDMKGGGVRGKLLYEPNDDTSITLSAVYSHINDPGSFLYNAYQGRTNGPIFFPGTPVATRRGEVANNDPVLYTADTIEAYLTGKFKIGDLDLTSYSGYQYVDVSELSFDFDATAAPFGSLSFPEKDHIFTQEFNLGGSTEKLDWVLGLFYMHQKARQSYNILTNDSNFRISQTGQTINAYAAFADGTYKITDSLFLTAGLRFGVDQLSALTAFAPDFIPSTPSHTFNGYDARVALRYQIDSDANIYASINRGSKAGSFNASAGNLDPVQPERITAYEVGYKVARRGWNFEAAAFDYEYRDMQVTQYLGELAYVVSAGKSRIYGVEGHFGFDIADGLKLDAGATYTRGRYLRFDNAQRYLFDPATGITATPGSDASGNRTTRTPKFSGQVAVNYRRDLLDGSLALTASYAYQSRINFDPFGDSFQKSFGLLNLRAAWTDPKSHWTLALYGKNVTDETYLSQVNSETTAIAQLYGRPATYGVEITYRY